MARTKRTGSRRTLPRLYAGLSRWPRNHTSQTGHQIDIHTLRTNLVTNISTSQSTDNFIGSFDIQEGWKDRELLLEIQQISQESTRKFVEAFEKSLHRLAKYKPSVDAVEKIIKKFPSSLSCTDARGLIPIQKAANGDGFEYVPILAKEGVKHKVGGEDTRGGLLKVDNEGRNTLQLLLEPDVEVLDVEDNDAVQRLDVLRELWNSKLLLKKDVQDYNLLDYSFSDNDRFEFMVELDPEALIETRVNNIPLIHYKAGTENSIRLLLKAGFKKHPKIGGLLFIKDDNGITAFHRFLLVHGKDEIMMILDDILSPANDFPILHHVFVKDHQHKELFTKRFPWAYHLKDHNGRTLHQAVLAAGPEVMNEHCELFASLTDDQIQMKDPATTLFPFAAMAVGEHADLEKSFYLLLRQPSVLEKRSRTTKNNLRGNKRKFSKERENSYYDF